MRVGGGTDVAELTSGTEQLGRRERRRLRRDALRVARRDEPLLELDTGPLTTQERELFFAQRDEALSRLRQILTSELLSTVEELAVLDRQIAELRDQEVRDSKQLNQLRSTPPSTPELDQVARARRARVRRRALTEAAAAASKTSTKLATAVERQAKLVAKLRTMNLRYETELELVHRLAVLRRSTFDESLVKHHRHRSFLADRLDQDVPPVPAELAEQLVRMGGWAGEVSE
ncbi:hypothetical protein E1263_10360 [Kribbella antibiotica]|uniref:Uncharacterized protein n=1 Tax=Kribbella antibiotica TaxID=190195 RepID=A0A4R4ZRW5_9ACTN|nr:hypothetical protein [Kribbella antibiotica]TDD60669.1 hypothetical protein E1263_10360 [Kribbella antibiotica]